MTSRLGSRLVRVVLALGLAAAIVPAPAAAQQVPEMPAPVAVTVSASSTALLVMDIISPLCTSQPNCVAFVPRLAALIAAVRKAGGLVVYSAALPGGLTAPVTAPAFLPAIEPAKGDPIVPGAGQDRFYSTALDGLLRGHHVTTLILAGWRENGSVLYTAVGANLHGYTAVVPEDCTSASTPADVAIGRYQLLTQLNNNVKNESLKPGAVTLSRSDLIAIR